MAYCLCIVSHHGSFSFFKFCEVPRAAIHVALTSDSVEGATLTASYEEY